MDDIKLFTKKKKKWKRIGDSDRNNKNIQPVFRNRIWVKNVPCFNEKGKKKNTEQIELPNQERTKMLG